MSNVFKKIIFTMLITSMVISPNLKESKSLASEETNKTNYVTAKDLYDRYVKAAGGDETTQNYSFDYSKDAPVYEQLSIIKFTQTASGKLGGYALDVKGKVWSWGYNTEGRLGLGLGSGASATDPTVLNYAGGMRRLPYFVDNDITVTKIAAGHHTAYAMDSNGNLYAWGRGYEGQMGNGDNKMDNPTPIKVNIPAKIVDFYPSNSETAHHIAAVDENGDIWMWGYGHQGRIPKNLWPGTSTYIKTPVKVSAPEGVKFIEISPASRATTALAEDGTVWSMGNNYQGGLGDGTTTGVVDNNKYTTEFKQIQTLSNIISIDSCYARNIALDSDGNVYEWGQIYGAGPARGSSRIVSTPEKVIIDEADIAYVGYTPIAKKVFAGESVSFFIDQKGRSWAWGDGRYHGQAREGGYNVALDFRQAKATLYPRIIGDGNTQFNDTNDKFPKYITGTGIKPSSKKGYGINDLNPTAWDEKYMLKNEEGNVLDSEGNILTLNKDGMYVKSNNEIGMPAVDPDESWIGLTFLEPAQMVDISTERSSSVFLDASGNIFKTSYDGSGSIAWGWDYESSYDQNGDLKRGIYDRYVYEMVFMRGAPTMPQGVMSFVAPEGKVYKVTNEEKLTFEVKAKLPTLNIDPNLNLGDITPEFKSMEYIKIPYDMTNEDAYKYIQNSSALTNKDFEDLMAKGYEYGNVAEIEENSKEASGKVSVDDNCIVVFRTKTDVYGSDSIGVDAYVVDNFYTPVAAEHNGIGDASVTIKDSNGKDINLSDHGGEKNQEVYSYTKDNISKIVDKDTNTAVFGFPLDSNGNIIDKVPDGKGGVVDGEPTYKYDSIEISSYDKDKYKLDGWNLINDDTQIIDGNIAKEKIVLDSKFNGTEQLNNRVLKHTFKYEANENIISKVKIDIIDQDIPRNKDDDKDFVHVEISNNDKDAKVKKGRIYIFKNNISGQITKPIDALEENNIIGVFDTDENGKISTETNDVFAKAMITEFGGWPEKNLVQKIPTEGLVTEEGNYYPIKVIFQQGDYTGTNIEGRKLLSNIDTGIVMDKPDIEKVKYTLFTINKTGIQLMSENGAKLNVEDTNNNSLIQDALLSDKKQVVRYTKKPNSGDKIIITISKVGKADQVIIETIK